MKTKLILSICFIIMIAGFKLINPSPNGVLSGNAAQPVYPNNNIWDKFILGSMSEEWDYQWNYTHSDQLKLNVSHIYNDIDSIAWNGGYRLTPIGRTNNDKLLTPIDNYKTEVTAYLKDIYDNHNGRRSITMRPKIAWLCYGQSSIYEAESIDPGNDLWFYSFNENTGTLVRDNEYGDGHDVLRCSISQLGPNGRYILKRLKANTEQSNAGVNYYDDKRCDWFVKPRIRIDPNINLNTLVCRVDIYSQNGFYPNNPSLNRLKSTDIVARDFRDEGHPYTGQYIEEFFFPPGTDLKITGNWGDKYVYKARGTRQNDTGLENKSDIQVYWYANCDMWIDYVKVENDVADDLLSNNPLNPNWVQYNSWIRDEVEQIAFAGDPGGVPPMLKFYIELTEFNNLPCAAYVNQKLKEYSASYSGGSYTVDLMADFTNLNMVHVPWDKRNTISSPGWVYTNYVQKVGLTQFFAESYPLTSLYTNPSQTWSKIPETLPITSGWGVLANPTTTAAYDTWLQDNMDHSPYVLETGEAGADIPFSYRSNDCNQDTLYQDEGNFSWIMNLGDEISKIGNIPFIFMPQDHLWYTKGEVRREPTNEELDLMANVSVSYGARGLMWFYFHSEAETSNPCTRYARGILDVNNNFRTENVYGQGHQYQQAYKWEVIRDISQRMKGWELYLLKFNDADRKSCIYRNSGERNTFLSNTYIREIITYKKGVMMKQR